MDELFTLHSNSLNAMVGALYPYERSPNTDRAVVFLIRCVQNLYAQNLILHDKLEQVLKEKENNA